MGKNLYYARLSKEIFHRILNGIKDFIVSELFSAFNHIPRALKALYLELSVFSSLSNVELVIQEM